MILYICDIYVIVWFDFWKYVFENVISKVFIYVCLYNNLYNTELIVNLIAVFLIAVFLFKSFDLEIIMDFYIAILCFDTF